MRYTQITLNGVDDEPTQEQLEVIWGLLEDAAEDGWLRPDQDGNVDEEVDETDLRSLLMTNMPKAAAEFGYVRIYGEEAKIHEFNFPEFLCGTYSVRHIYGKNPVYSFEQWEV